MFLLVTVQKQLLAFSFLKVTSSFFIRRERRRASAFSLKRRDSISFGEQLVVFASFPFCSQMGRTNSVAALYMAPREQRFGDFFLTRTRQPFCTHSRREQKANKKTPNIHFLTACLEATEWNGRGKTGANCFLFFSLDDARCSISCAGVSIADTK